MSLCPDTVAPSARARHDIGVVWLVLDTASPLATIAVVNVAPRDGGASCVTVIAERTLTDTRRHAEALSAAVDDALADAGVGFGDVDGIGAGVGPGSFIGVRTGLAFAQGLARACACPVVGLDGLVALAGSVDDDLLTSLSVDGVAECVAVIDARRGEHYVGRVVARGVGDERRFEALTTPTAVAPADVDIAGAALVIGAADTLPRHAWPTTPVVVTRSGPSALGLARALATALHARSVDPSLLPEPVYVRGADAKVPAVDPAARRASILKDLDARGVQTADDEGGQA